MKFGEKKYDTQFANTGRKSKELMRGMHKIDLDMKFTNIKTKKGIKIRIELVVAAMKMEYT